MRRRRLCRHSTSGGRRRRRQRHCLPPTVPTGTAPPPVSESAPEGCGLWASTIMLTSSSSLSLKPQLALGEAVEGKELSSQAQALGSEDRQFNNPYRPSVFTVRASAGSAGSRLVPDGGVIMTAPERHRPGTRVVGEVGRGGTRKGGGDEEDEPGGGPGGGRARGERGAGETVDTQHQWADSAEALRLKHVRCAPCLPSNRLHRRRRCRRAEEPRGSEAMVPTGTMQVRQVEGRAASRYGRGDTCSSTK